MGKNRKKRMLALLLVFVVSLTFVQPNVQAAAAVKTKTVTSQAQLNAALKNKSVTAVTIKAGGKLTLTLKADSALTTVTIAKKATVTMKGKSAKSITVENKAAGTVLKTSVPVALKNTKKMSATFLTGADGSTITAKADMNAKTDVALAKISKSSAKLNVKVQANAKSIGELRIAYNGDIYTLQAYKSKTNDTVWLPVNAVKKLTGKTAASVKIGGKDYASLSLLADSCVYDEALASLYVWTDMPVSYLDDESRIAYYGLGKMSDQAITFKEYFALLDQAVSQTEPTKLAKWKKMLPKARKSDKTMLRIEGAAVLLYAAAALGSPYAEFNAEWVKIYDRMGDKLWNGEYAVFWQDSEALERLPVNNPYTLGGFEESPYVTGWTIDATAAFYGFGRASLVNGKLLFDYDEEENSMHYGEALTVADAKRAVSRFLDSVTPKREWTAVNNPAARHYDSSVITEQHLALAGTMPEISGENPPLWYGGVCGVREYRDVEGLFLNRHEFTLRKMSEYGFNTARYMLSYETLFDRTAGKVDLHALRELDAVVAMAMKYRIHLNLVTATLPGRWLLYDADGFDTEGEFDMFTNPDRQREADAVWDLLAERYAGIPSSVLSFAPLWETNNTNLSSGKQGAVYTAEDVAATYVRLIELIRARDPGRFIIYEVGEACALIPEEIEFDTAPAVVEAVTSRFENVQMLGNICEAPFVYSDMTNDEGVSIDACNHGLFKPEYPVTYYGVRHWIAVDEPLTLTGELVKGTVLNLYLRSSNESGKLCILGDGELLYEEEIPPEEQDYHVQSSISGYILYAKSDKMVSVTLKKDYKKITMICEGNSFVKWSGLDVTLPDSYAVDRWYYDSAYDAFLEGREWVPPTLTATSQILISPWYSADATQITIHPDVRFTTDEMINEASAATMDIHLGKCDSIAARSAVRMENVGSSVGTSLTSALRYYDDMLSTCEKYGIGWYTNEIQFGFLFQKETDNPWTNMSGFEYKICDGTLVCVELLKLFQSHMEKPVKLN